MELNTGHLLAGGRYRIERVLGQGGFGITYEARDTRFKSRAKSVAIKEFFVKDFCNRENETNRMVVATQGKVELIDRLRNKFIDEANALFELEHTNIVRVTDIFEENATAYYVMEYVSGSSLSSIVEGNGKLSETDALGYIRQIAGALKYVHSHNRLHLDVKPQNIMVDDNGKAVLIDFGVSKQYDEANGENTSTLLGCTPGYAPIEQIGGEIVEFHAATDVYSLGATLYKLITGITPVSANKRASSAKLKEVTFPDDVTPATRAAVEAAMRLYVENRPQSIDEFLALLDGSSAGVISNVSEKSQTPDDDGETVVSFDNSSSTLGGEVSHSDGGEKSQSARPVISNVSEKSPNKSAKEEILRSAQDDKGAKKDEPADRVISNGSEKSQNTPFNKKWLIIAAITFVAVIFGVNWYGDYRAAEAERRQAEIALAEQQRLETARLEAARLAQEEAARRAEEDRKAKEEAERKRKEAAQTRGTINGHDYVDLGLSVKWATCNVGASSPEGYGDYYAWGETTTKSSYTEKTSATDGKQMGSIAGNPTYDVARKKWGSPWRLPTKAEFDELKDNCTWTWTTQNGHNGYKVTSKKNGNSIFLPAAGWRDGSSSKGQGSCGYYWSATPDESYTDDAYCFGFVKGNRLTHSNFRIYGYRVRPVSQN